LPGIVVDVAAERVVVDFNHPLAGEPVIMEFEILAVDSPSGKVEQ